MFDNTSFDSQSFDETSFLLGEAVLVEVPDVVSQSQASGTSELEGEGFVVAVQTAYSDTVASGDIISQSPTAGSEAAEGSTVTITVSLGPEPESTQKPAGRPRRHRRFLVEIDGQDFEVSGPQEAQALLDRAKAVATKAIEKASKAPTRIAPGRPGIPRPVIRTASPELRAVVQRASREISSLYDNAVRDLEIAALMAKRFEDEEEEALIQLLM